LLTSTPKILMIDHEEKLRQKFLRLVDGHGPCIHYAHQVYNLVHSERILDWLLSRGLRGKDLDAWVQEKHGGSILTAVSFIVSEVNRAPQRPVRLGVEYGRG